jgi:hypothetical protein
MDYEMCGECEQKISGEKGLNDLCESIGCNLINKCCMDVLNNDFPSPSKIAGCQLLAMCGNVRDAVGKRLLGKYKYRVNTGRTDKYGDGRGGTSWCRWVSVCKHNEEGDRIGEYVLTFRLDNYPEIKPKDKNDKKCFWVEKKGYGHELSRIGYIQFVELRNPTNLDSKHKEYDQYATPSYWDGQQWWLPGETDSTGKVHPKAGEVQPLNLDDIDGRIKVSWVQEERHIFVTDFFDAQGVLDVNRVKELAKVFLEWIVKVETIRTPNGSNPPTP